ncbi:MAG TPA: cation-translocating P-type ATPase [Luteitalea sp.]|nr:cation-translocating P-type ATPase [Luteitalea sp.]
MNAPVCRLCTDHRAEAFHVPEMCCANEVALLERRLASMDGVRALNADVLTRRLDVHFDAATVSTGQIAEAVAQSGMRAWPITAGGEAPATETPSTWPIIAAAVSCLVAGAVFIAGGPDLLLRGLLLVAIALTAPATLQRAWKALRGSRLDIHVLMIVAVIGALAIDEWFEAATVLVLFGIAQALEARSLERARRAIADVLTVTPPTAELRRGDVTKTVPVEQVAVGQVVIVRPGARVPLDGIVRTGESTVNQAPVTGESVPVLKEAGDSVYAGSVNGDSALSIEVTRVSSDSTVARIVHMVERAQASRAQVQSTVDRFAAVYTPVVLGLAAVMAVLPPLVTGGSWAVWIERALVLLVVACPCALVIATPVAMVSALSAAARRGLLLKGGAVLERLASVEIVALDKTGTVSEGRLGLSRVTSLGGLPEAETMQLAASLEAGVHHPLAEAIVDAATSRGLTPLAVESVQHVAGRGASGIVDGRHVRIGRPDWLASALPADVVIPDATAVLVVDGAPVLAIEAVDSARPSAAPALSRLRALGLQLAMLSGDHAPAVQRTAAEVGITEWHARLLPEDKAAAVSELASRGAVLMVGDGINDGPALAAATVSLAVADGGSAVAIEAADGALMHRDLALVPYAISLGRAALRTVRVNVALALALKVAVIVAAALGLASLWLAVLADVGASLLVVALSLRLLSFEAVAGARA